MYVTPKVKALIIGKIWPEPTSSAAGKRTLDIVRALQEAGWEVHFASAAKSGEHSFELDTQLGVASHQIELNRSSFERWIATLAPDVVIFDRYMTEEQFGWRVENALPQALRILDTSDLHFLREARKQALRTQKPPQLHNGVALREIASIYRCDLTLVISENELELLDAEFALPSELLAYWPYCLPEPGLPSPSYSDRHDFAMIGSFLHEPNWDAVRFCRETIWPEIRRRLPQANLHIYGSYTPEKARQLHNPGSGFHICGRTKDATETLKRHRLNLAPLRFGAGLKGKLTDAFLAGTPSVASPIAIEGLPGSLPWGSPIHDDPTLFAEVAVELYQSEPLWRQAQECGYEIARQRFHEKTWLKRLPTMLGQAKQSLGERRQRNFTGQMLRHHQHRSTEFMSRWIETKRLLSEKE